MKHPTNTATSSATRVTRSKKPPPDLLAILEAVNLIPVDAKMPTLYQLETGQVTLVEAVKAGGEDFWLWVFASGWVWKPDGGWGKRLGQTLDSSVIPAPWNPLYRYISVITWRETLRSIALRYQNGFTATVRMEIDPNTGHPKSIPTGHDPLARILWSVDFDSRYVRQCAVDSCRRLFWASRLTDEQLKDPHAELGHDQRHANTLSARRSRRQKKLAEVRNAKWRANYRLRYKEQRNSKRLPGRELIDQIRRTLSKKKVWPNFDPENIEHIQLLAEQHEISPATCRAALNYVGNHLFVEKRKQK